MGVIRGHHSSHFWGAAKLQSATGADDPRCVAVIVYAYIDDSVKRHNQSGAVADVDHTRSAATCLRDSHQRHSALHRRTLLGQGPTEC